MAVKFIEELTAPTKARIKLGDLFAYKIGPSYRFILVARELDSGVGWKQYLLYFYSATSSDPYQVPPLNKHDLLMPITLAFPFFLKEGYTLKIGSGDFAADEVFDRHCFKQIPRSLLLEPTETRFRIEDGELVTSKGSPVRRVPIPQKPYRDESGEVFDELFEPLVPSENPVSLEAAEYRIAKALGLVASLGAYESLPDLRRPHYRKSMTGKLPHPMVRLIIPGFMSGPAQSILQLNIKTDKYCTSEREVDRASTMLWRYFVQRGNLSDLARAGEPLGVESRSGNFVMYFTVKGRQFEEFFSAVDLLLKAIGIQSYWIEDYLLYDWLAGTYKDPNHRTL